MVLEFFISFFKILIINSLFLRIYFMLSIRVLIVNILFVVLIAINLFQLWILLDFAGASKYDLTPIIFFYTIWNVLFAVLYGVSMLVCFFVKLSRHRIATIILLIIQIMLIVAHIIYFYSVVGSITSAYAIVAIFDPSNYLQTSLQ